MSGFRRAAIALHGVSSSDRASILKALPDADRTVLEGLLDELESLGFDSAICAGVAEAKDSSIALDNRLKDALESADAEHIYPILAPEPDLLIAALLATRQWRWRDRFLALLSVHRRERVLACKVRSGPGRDAVIVAQLTRRLRERAQGSSDVGGPARHVSTAVMRHAMPIKEKWVPPWKR